MIATRKDAESLTNGLDQIRKSFSGSNADSFDGEMRVAVAAVAAINKEVEIIKPSLPLRKISARLLEAIYGDGPTAQSGCTWVLSQVLRDIVWLTFCGIAECDQLSLGRLREECCELDAEGRKRVAMALRSIADECEQDDFGSQCDDD